MSEHCDNAPPAASSTGLGHVCYTAIDLLIEIWLLAYLFVYLNILRVDYAYLYHGLRPVLFLD
jgi:hypothetical protein